MINKLEPPNSEALIRRTVDALVKHGYKDAGYEYVVIDDCWLEMSRDPETQRLVPDRQRFPNGMKAVGDYVGDEEKNEKIEWTK